MHEILEKYANSIIDSLLRLQKGDCLSINVDERDFDFARIIANLAVERTCSICKIVQTTEGRPTEVIDFDPEITKAVESTGYAMLTLRHESESTVSEGKVLDVIVDKNDLRAIQKLGHLAEPVVLDRRVSIPWATVPIFGSKDERWKELFEILDNDLDGSILTSDYRRHYFNHADIDFVHINGEDTDFEFKIPENNLFTGGSYKLRNNRKFVSGMDFATFRTNIDSNSLTGKLHAFSTILGKKCEIDMEFENGRILKHSDCPQLDRILGFDEKLNKVGYIAFSDRKLSLYLGGALTDCLDVLPDNENSLPAWFNDSLYSVELILNSKLNAHFKNCNGQEKELIRSGFIVE